MHDFRSANADRDSQDLRTGHSLAESCIKAVAGLFDKSKMEPGRVSNCLNVVTVVEVGSRNRNCRMLSLVQARYCLRKCRAQIGILFAAVASPPTGIHTELL